MEKEELREELDKTIRNRIVTDRRDDTIVKSLKELADIENARYTKLNG